MVDKGVRKEQASMEWVSLVEASKLLGQSRQTILARIVKGDLDGQFIAGRTVVSRASVERAMEAV